MNPSPDVTSGRRNPLWYLILVFVIALIVGGYVYFGRRPTGPKLLNEPTKARETRPLTTQPDPRFDPLPFEKEEHEN